MGFVPSVGKREYDCFLAWSRGELRSRDSLVGSGMVGSSVACAADANGLSCFVGEAKDGPRESMLVFSIPIRLDRLSDLFLKGPDGDLGEKTWSAKTGSWRWLPNANSLGPHILISCVSPTFQCRLFLGLKEVV